THLEPAQRIATFEILRPRRPGEPIALSWWRRRIGSTTDLGHIPTMAHLPRRRCAPGRACASYLIVDARRATTRPPTFSVPIRIGKLSFVVTFASDPGVKRYVVPLARLWFWSAAPNSATRTVRVERADGATETVVRRVPNPDVL